MSTLGRAPLTLLLLLLACASLAVSQLCSPSYEERVIPLMDTYTIPLLLPNTNHDGTWQSLDLDDNNLVGQQTMWSPGGLACLNKLYVCGFNVGPQNNWLITQYISRQVEIGETALESVEVTFDIVFSSICASDPSCIEALSLYVWETSTSNPASATDTSNYRFVGNVTADVSELTLTFMSQHSGFYLGIRDNGTCLGGMDGAALNRVLVSYKSCPSDTLGLVSVTEVIAGTESVLGLCVGNSSAVQGGGALLSCSDNGEWRVLSGCECDPGYWLSEETQKCVECPSNSEGTEAGLSECPCVQNYYRAPDEGAGEACTQPPSAPRNITVSNLTNTSIVLNWLSPEHNGERNTNEITYTVSYRASSSHQPGMNVTTEHNTIVLSDLTPYVSYVFSITAENQVSSQSPDASGSTASINATTLEGVAARVTILGLVSQDTLEWSPPDPAHGAIIYYNIRVVHQQRERTIMKYNQTSITTMVLIRNWNVTDGSFKVQVQAVTRVGAGEFSESVTVFVTDEGPTAVSDILLISILVPAVFVLILIVALLMLMVYVSVRLTKLRQNHRPHTAKRDINYAIEDYASVKMSGQHFSDGGEGGLGPPAVPTSPCPTLTRVKTSENRSVSRDGLSDAPGSDAGYAVLEGPGHHNTVVSDNERLYTPDPTMNFLEATNLLALTGESDQTTEGVDPTSTSGNQPLYWELEAPREPTSRVQQREQRREHAPPGTATYWNEGLGPPGSKPFTTPHNTSNTSTSTTRRSESGEPFYLQLTTQNT